MAKRNIRIAHRLLSGVVVPALHQPQILKQKLLMEVKIMRVQIKTLHSDNLLRTIHSPYLEDHLRKGDAPLLLQEELHF